MLLRVGSSKTYQIQLAEYVLDLMSTSVTNEEKEDFNLFKRNYEELLEEFYQLDEEIDNFIKLRNSG